MATVVLVHTKNIVALFSGLLSLCFGYATLLLLQPSGHIMLVALAAVFACDSAAYFAEEGWRAKLWPRVSPGKTVSGAIAGLIAATG